MTISSYQVENVLRTYTKQSNSRRSALSTGDSAQTRQDIVTLSGGTTQGAYDKISYSLLDILLHNKEVK